MPAERSEEFGGDLIAHDVVRRVAGGRVVLDRISATFGAGSVTVVLGGNGVGKSTLARVLAGVDRADGGTLTRPARRAYFLPERVPVLASCSTRVVAAALAPSLSRSGSSRAPRLEAALDRLGFTHDVDTPLHRLSKGNVQKAYLAVAYALSPAVVVLDEPMTGTDPASRAAIGALLRSTAGDGGIVVMTAHQPVQGVDVHLELAGGRLNPYEPPSGVRTAPAHSVGPRYRVDLVVGGADVEGWSSSEDGPAYDIVRGVDHENVLRLLVNRDSLAQVLRRALDRGDAVVRVVEDHS